ncbi:MAG: M1 family metallopeptidase, partial [Planctomycetes bacterium]|nr:M1 family metallopeptidase [Planctomycetota bacterium]
MIEDKIGDIDIRLLLQPDHAAHEQRYLDAARVAFEHYQKWYGDYPFPNMTIVDPRRGALGSAGMEYPTLITGLSMYGLPENVRLIELVVIHEIGHNFWYHLVASNEFEESWLDEGINNYSEYLIVEKAYGPEGSLIDLYDFKLGELQQRRMGYVAFHNFDR